MDSSKSKIIFVHDFGLDSTSWKSMIDFINKDGELYNHFELYNFSFEELWSKLGFNSLRTIVNEFGDWIEETGLYESNSVSLSNITDSVFFICHGHGGLLLCATLKNYIEQNSGGIHNNFLRRIRQIVFFETPLISYEAIDLITEKKIIKLQAYNLKDYNEILENLEDEIEDCLKFFEEKVICADDYHPNELPISTLLFYGENEPNLPKWFEKKITKKINSDNSISIIDQNDSFINLKSYLLHPIGHLNTFEVEYRYTEVVIEPNLHNPVIITYGKNSREIISENRGYNPVKVKFSERNIYDKPFRLKYTTTTQGAGIKAVYSPLNAQIAPISKISEYEKELKEFTFDFIAKPNQEFRLAVEVFKGFDGIENQNVHFHVGNGKFFYKNYRLELNLSKFSPTDYEFLQIPEVHFFNEEDHLCKETVHFRIQEYLVKPTLADEESRIWVWNFYNIRSGVVDLFWKLVPFEIEKLRKPQNIEKTIKIFLASSFELKQERKTFQQLINEINTEINSKGICLELIMWEHESAAVSQTRLQDEYNKLIPTCNLFVGLFYSKIGTYTREEFDIAFSLFNKNKTPKIHLYFKKGSLEIDDLLESEGSRALFRFNDELKELGHFNFYFKDDMILKKHFRKQIDLYLDDLDKI